MKPRDHLKVDAALFGLFVWVSGSAALGHMAQGADPHLKFMLHVFHAIGGALMTVTVGVHLALHLLWIRSQLRAPARPLGQTHPLVPEPTNTAEPCEPKVAAGPGRRTRLHLPFPRHVATPYIRLNTHRCQACWECTRACPRGVLGRAVLLRHRHAHVDEAAACKGCGKCVKACPNEAILLLRRRPSTARAQA